MLPIAIFCDGAASQRRLFSTLHVDGSRDSSCGETYSRDPAEIAKADSCVESLGHRGRLQARRLTASRERVVQVRDGERGTKPRRQAPSNVPTL
jgi:hypothetical protein